jgi:hypothetical protein
MKYHLHDPEGSAEIIKNEVLKAHKVSDEDKLLTTGQVLGLLMEKCEKDGEEYVLDDETLNQVTKDSQSILIGTMLSRMASQGELECYWDGEANDMVWSLPK